ncbi:Replication factor A protein 1 [Nowakowskiella sp. JEL0078]|nr:Replication factor A protein 1 [Nowakowskiella sp. JEL0078]
MLDSTSQNNNPPQVIQQPAFQNNFNPQQSNFQQQQQQQQQQPPSPQNQFQKQQFQQRQQFQQAPQQQQNFNNQIQNRPAPTSALPPSSSGLSAKIFPISSVSPYQNKWTIKARVISKSEIKTWTNQKGTGRLFSCVLSDESGEIKATAFNDAVDRFWDVIQENGVYTISGCPVKFANKRFNDLPNDYEINFDGACVVDPCADAKEIPGVRYNFVGLDRLGEYEKDATMGNYINILPSIQTVVKDHGELTQLTSKTTQKQLQKRDLTVCDTTGFEVRFTLWGKAAETWSDTSPVVLAVRNARVGEYLGSRNLGAGFSSTLQINPDIDETYKLKTWFDEHGSSIGFNSYRGEGGGGGGTGKCITINEVEALGLGHGEKPDFFSLRGRILFVRRENFSYEACARQGCNKKVVSTGDGYRCESCNVTHEKPDHRYIVSMTLADHTGQIWATMFNEQVEAVVGMSAENMLELQSSDPAEFDARWNAILFREDVYRMRVKAENYQDELKLKFGVSGTKGMDYAVNSLELIGLIERY